MTTEDVFTSNKGRGQESLNVVMLWSTLGKCWARNLRQTKGHMRSIKCVIIDDNSGGEILVLENKNFHVIRVRRIR